VARLHNISRLQTADKIRQDNFTGVRKIR